MTQMLHGIQFRIGVAIASCGAWACLRDDGRLHLDRITNQRHGTHRAELVSLFDSRDHAQAYPDVRREDSAGLLDLTPCFVTGIHLIEAISKADLLDLCSGIGTQTYGLTSAGAKVRSEVPSIDVRTQPDVLIERCLQLFHEVQAKVAA